MCENKKCRKNINLILLLNNVYISNDGDMDMSKKSD